MRNMSADSGMSIGIAGGLIGAVITVILYWIDLLIFNQPLITESGVWIVIFVSAFLTGFITNAVAQ